MSSTRGVRCPVRKFDVVFAGIPPEFLSRYLGRTNLALADQSVSSGSKAAQMRLRFLALIHLCLLTSVAAEATATNMCFPASLPPVEPQDESSSGVDDALVADCLTLVRQRFAKLDYLFGRPLFTKQATWGEIVRIDLKVSGKPDYPERYSRIVCFHQTGLPVKMGFFDIPKSACKGESITILPPGVH